MAPRCREYLIPGSECADIVLDSNQYRYEKLPDNPEMVAYLDSGFQFYRQLLRYDGMMLHASAVSYKNQAFLFSGHCGVGKSTHTHLWQKVFGCEAKIINDDKPAIRNMNGVWYAYGTPWSGKHGINCNLKVPISGICFMKQSKQNSIRRLNPKESLAYLLSQTPHRYKLVEDIDALLLVVDRLIKDIPIYEMENRPEPEAVWLAYNTMHRASREEIIETKT